MNYKNTCYYITKLSIGPFFKLAYRPTVLNKNLIPSKRPIILCGNHLHVWDQLPVICTLDEITHWMAKKEYFEGSLAPLFKMTGAISVDRNGDASSATKEAIELLNKGETVGLFPEGTRNHPKDSHIESLLSKLYLPNSYKESLALKIRNNNPYLSQLLFLEQLYEDNRITKQQYIMGITDCKTYLCELQKKNMISNYELNNSLLLPFKLGALSIAKKTNALIVPFGITGDFKVGNKNLILKFGDYIDPNNYDIINGTKILRNNILKLVKTEYLK